MKSHVSMEQHKCAVCCKDYDTGSILLDKRLKQSLESSTVVGWGLCKEHQQLANDGYIALIACDEARSERDAKGGITLAGAWRLGDYAHVRRTAARRLFNIPFTDDQALMFCDAEVIAMLKEHTA